MAKRRKTKAQARPRRQALAAWRAHLPGLLAGLLVLATVGGVAAGVRLLFDPQRFPLQTVEVRGRLAVLDPQEVAAVLAPLWRGQGFFSVDVAALREAAEGLAWIRRAQVRRVWPDRLVVTVEEQVPAARWGREALLNAEGDRFAAEGRSVDGALPRLDGPEGTEREVLATWLAWSERLRGIGLQPVRLALDARRAWRLELADGMRLELGRKEAEARLARFLAAWPRVRAMTPDREPLHVDLRYSNGFAVRWRARGLAGAEGAS